jgi:hypothetical protein
MIEVLGRLAQSIYGLRHQRVIIITTKQQQGAPVQHHPTDGHLLAGQRAGSRTFNTLDEALAAFNPDSTVTRLFNEAGARRTTRRPLRPERSVLRDLGHVMGGLTDPPLHSGLLKNDEDRHNTGYRKQRSGERRPVAGTDPASANSNAPQPNAAGAVE